jgi:formylmethanofuran dehydrogenase subunit E
MMHYPAFFDQAPAITMRDPLAALLGAADDGLIDYHYIDAVRLAGHSCPTVAGAYLMARAALRTLYPEGPAERGAVTVHMPGTEEAGVNGVITQVFTLITGAAAANGFHGIAGRFVRQSLLSFAGSCGGDALQVRRSDTGEGVSVQLDMASVPAPANLRSLLGAALDPEATPQQRAAFAQAWQGRVKLLLLEHADDPEVVRLTRLH